MLTIKEYQDKFNELFRQLQKEHGKPKKVVIEADYIYDDVGYPLESIPTTCITFE